MRIRYTISNTDYVKGRGMLFPFAKIKYHGSSRGELIKGSEIPTGNKVAMLLRLHATLIQKSYYITFWTFQATSYAVLCVSDVCCQMFLPWPTKMMIGHKLSNKNLLEDKSWYLRALWNKFLKSGVITSF